MANATIKTHAAQKNKFQVCHHYHLHSLTIKVMDTKTAKLVKFRIALWARFESDPSCSYGQSIFQPLTIVSPEHLREHRDEKRDFLTQGRGKRSARGKIHIPMATGLFIYTRLKFQWNKYCFEQIFHRFSMHDKIL